MVRVLKKSLFESACPAFLREVRGCVYGDWGNTNVNQNGSGMIVK
jgi:hypothetical protein